MDSSKCESQILSTDKYFSCFTGCPSSLATYAGEEKHQKSCFPAQCCEYKVFSQATVPDIVRYGDGTVISTADADVRALYFDVPNLAVTQCQG